MPVKHIQQQMVGYCLPACAEMAVAQFGVGISQSRLAKNLGTIPGVGTPFSALGRLAAYDFSVEVTEWRGTDFLRSALSVRKVAIAAILTSNDLPGWKDSPTQHTVLVTAVEEKRVRYHDPALSWAG